MEKPYRHLWVGLILVSCGLIGWWAGRDLKGTSVVSKLPEKPAAAGVLAEVKAPRPLKQLARDPSQVSTTVEIFASRQADEAILRFPTAASYGNFIDTFSSTKTQLVARLDRLRVVRLHYENWDDLSELLAGKKLAAYDSLSDSPAPNPASDTPQRGLVAFDEGVLSWLGVDSDHSTWGAGVKIAVLDSGIVAHSALPGFTTSIAITPYPEDLTQTRGHGTAVASLIAGNDPAAPGVAPAAELISVRVTDETGQADAFDLAAGILAAVDAGAQIINCSMGTTVDNPLIEEAVLFARDHGVLIVAAAGNSEQAEASYPAAYPSVISVGAVDARGEHLNFSNYGTYLSLTAPGYEVNTAWPGNAYTKMSGTSVSAPLVTGSIAATMSNGNGVTMTANAAAEIVMNQADEAGIPGPDSEYGMGILNLGRVMNRNTPNLVDAAITHQRLVRASKSGGEDEIQVTLQNRGTAVLLNTLLDVETPVGNRQFSVALLAPGAIQTFSMPVQLATWASGQPLRVHSTITLGMVGEDSTPRNNQRTDRLLPR
jgi:subtilisin family serine protease